MIAVAIVLCLIAVFSIEVTEDGIKALLAISNGDMRKILNILQVL